jgi:hypothetical protein
MFLRLQSVEAKAEEILQDPEDLEVVAEDLIRVELELLAKEMLVEEDTPPHILAVAVVVQVQPVELQVITLLELVAQELMHIVLG